MTLLLRFARLRICDPVCLCAWQPRGRVFSGGGAVAAVAAARSSRADSSSGPCWGASTRGRRGSVSSVVGGARRGVLLALARLFHLRRRQIRLSLRAGIVRLPSIARWRMPGVPAGLSPGLRLGTPLLTLHRLLRLHPLACAMVTLILRGGDTDFGVVRD